MAQRDRQAELVTEDELSELIRECPTLYHMAERDSWASIRRHGLLSTSALLDLWELKGERRDRIEAMRRPENVGIDHPMLGRVVIRDQKPMDDAGLHRCLQDGLAPTDWYRLLNQRVFFWLTRPRLLRLLGARPYRELEHDVLQLDTAAMVRAHWDRVTLSPINSGATKPFPTARGLRTFLPIEEYPYGEWRERRPRGERAVEFAVMGGVPDVTPFVRRVTRMRGGDVLSVLYDPST